MSNVRVETRNSAFELLRIFSMFMIIAHHCVNHGLINNPIFPGVFADGTNLNRFFAWLCFPGGEVGVALFFMITGFFCIDSKKIRIKKVVLQVAFYSWLSLCFYFTLKYLGFDFSNLFTSEVEKKYIIGSFIFPVRSGAFWFATAYILLRLFMPIYNTFLEKLNTKGFLLVLLVLFMALMQSQLFIVVLGYTKALFFYSLGGLLKKCKLNTNKYKGETV